MTEQMTVRKLDEKGVEVIRYSAQLIRRMHDGVVLEAIFDMEELDFPGLTFRSGDRFVETHYVDRWYNVLAIYDVDTSELKGWYCNITRPAQVRDGSVSSEDLALDLVVRLDGSWSVLDEDEYAALDLDSGDRAMAESALQELKEFADNLDGPFARRG